MAFVVFDLIDVVLGVAEKVLFAVEKGHGDIVLFEGDVAEVTALAKDLSAILGLVCLNLKAVQGKEILVGQLGMGNENVVIGVGNNGISLCRVGRLNLFGGQRAVGDGGVAMQICFVEKSIFGQ